MPSEHQPQEPTESLTFIEAVFKRPTMYTIHGSIEEVAAFLEGFYSGLAAHTNDTRRLRDAERWWRFLDWLHTDQKIASGAGWHEVFLEIKRLYPDRDEAMQYLFTSYQAYKRQQSDVSAEEINPSLPL